MEELAKHFNLPVEGLSFLPILVGMYVFLLAVIIGYLVISKVPPLLHTPLMSATNAISGISLVASIVTAGSAKPVSQVLGMLAVTAATINVVGGFLITDRMLRMFKKKDQIQ
ncbi:MAG: NAD(P) transhydrogenase subunit alpha [Deltaproteobacteria bacterium]|nr:NAD(P) transhydrogenase subunit alpha [Deltaproteobacteria bacterium]MDH4122025.1 NAD(P) transhydrogenase subunit alpha [Deltaproteobacteria bacterium]